MSIGQLTNNTPKKIEITKCETPKFPIRNIWEIIFSYLDFQDVFKCRQVCKQLYSYVPSEAVFTMKKITEKIQDYVKDKDVIYSKESLIKEISSFFQKTGTTRGMIFVIHSVTPLFFTQAIPFSDESVKIYLVPNSDQPFRRYTNFSTNYIDINHIYNQYIKKSIITWNNVDNCFTHQLSCETKETIQDIDASGDFPYTISIEQNLYPSTKPFFSFSEIEELMKKLYTESLHGKL